MKLTINSKELLAYLTAVSPAIDGNPVLPILSGYYLKSVGGNLQIVAASSKLWMQCNSEIECEDMDVVVPPVFYEKLKAAPNTAIDLLFTEGEHGAVSCTMTFGKSKSVITCDTGKDFIVKPTVNKECSFSIPVNELKEALLLCSPFANTSDDLDLLIGTILFKCQDGKLDIVATDRKKMCIERITLAEELDFSFVMDTKEILKLLKFLETGKTVTFSVGKSHVTVSTENTFCSLTRIDFGAMNYQQFLEIEQTNSVTFSKSEMESALNRVKITTSNLHTSATIGFNTNEIVIDSKSDVGDTSKEIVCGGLGGETFENGYQINSFLIVLKSLPNENDLLTVDTNGKGSPLYFETEKGTRLLMPYLIPNSQ